MRHTKRQLVWFLSFIWMFFLPMHAGCQEQDGPYKGLEDGDMIQILKDFPHKANRWNVPAEDGRLLYDLIISNNYKEVVEVGTSNGYSALWMGFALKKTGGRLITLEINRQRALEARQNIEEAGLSSVIEVRLNDALDELPKLDGPIDMVFLDADKSQYIEYFQYLDELVRPGGAISAHNVSTMEYAMRDFLQALRNRSLYETNIHRDSRQGLLVAYKRENAEGQ